MEKISHENDHVLMLRAKKGDKKAFDELCALYMNELFLYFLSRSSNREDAMDLVSETFERVIKYLQNFRGDASFRTWIYHIAKNILVDYYSRKSKRKEVFTGDYELVDESNPETDDPETNPENLKDLQKIMDKLPPKYKEILELRHLLNFSFAECAQSMKITENNAKVLHFRALKQAQEVAENIFK